MSSSIEAFLLSGLFEPLLAHLPLADVAADGFSIRWWIDFLLHLDDKLKELIRDYGLWTHLILFAVIFCETGLVVTPFLPGDSLLFAAGAFAADGSLRIGWLIPLFIVAAVLGDTVNYWAGKWFGEHAFTGRIPFLNKKHLDEAHAFFEKWGGISIILARFMPIVRTFAPFVAGIGSMNYRTFIAYNIGGAVVWVVPLVLAGYQFGQLEIVKENFELVILGILFISVLPMVVKIGLDRFGKKKADAIPAAPVEGT